MAAPDHSVVTTTSGPVRGKPAGTEDVWMYRGIPYAAPPVGERRWQPPAPPAGWSEVRDATSFGPTAPQNPSALDRALGARRATSDEDCLRVNVWTPAPDDGHRPVLVWIHGGGFTGGSGGTPWYDGRALCRRGDVVVVTLNYRLGALGFLETGGEGPAPHGGNCGLLDQVAALGWVRDNIAAFGGDPANVTVFGESAGAMSIGSLLAMPAAAGLFRRAILQSGAAHNVSDGARARGVAAEVLEAAGAADLEGLRRLDADRILAAQAEVEARHQGAELAFQPVSGTPDLPHPPLEAVRNGSAAGVALLVGTTLEEMRLFGVWDPALGTLDDAGVARRYARQLGEGAEAMVAAYRQGRPEASAGDLWIAMGTDSVFRIPGIRLLEAQLDHTPTCWSYLFTVRSTAFDGLLGSCHALEIPFVFGTLDGPGVAMFTGSPEGAREVSEAMQDAWIAFARHGDPGHTAIPDWPPYDTARRPTMEFGTTLRILDDPAGAERRLWDHIR